MRSTWANILLFVLLTFIVLAFFNADPPRVLTLSYLQAQKLRLLELYSSYPLQTTGAYLLLYIGLAAFSVPGALMLTAAAGVIFGLWLGVCLASVGAALGATGAFLNCRYLIGSLVQRRFGSKLIKINRGIRENGVIYLLALRLTPVVPYFLVNLLMGLTPIPAHTFLWVTYLGMLPLTFVYVYAGTQLSQIQSLRDVFSWPLLLVFTSIGVMPIFAKKLIQWVKRRRKIARRF